MKVIDITIPHSDAFALWTSATPVHYRLSDPIPELASCHAGDLTGITHHGTHLDAPYHCHDGPAIDDLPTERFVGPARVFAAHGHDPIPREVFAGLDGHATPRVLVATGSCDDRSVLPSRIPTLAPDVPAWLGAQGVTLIGLDVPSVDPLDSHTLSNHRAFDAAGILILGNLNLRDVTPGEYELIAVPLRMTGDGGSPVRAMLVGA